MVAERGQRLAIEVDPRVVPVAVVRIDEVRTALALGGWDFGSGAGVSHGHEPHGDFTGVEIVEAELRAMRTQGRPGCRGGLQDGHVSDPSVFAVQIDRHAVGSRLVQPVDRPVSEFTARRSGDLYEEVVDRRVPVGMRHQIGADAAPERLLPHQVVELRQRGRTLVVGDGVEVRESGVGVRGRQFDGVRGIAFVRAIGADGAPIGAEPSLRELGSFHQRQRRHEGGKRLIQP